MATKLQFGSDEHIRLTKLADAMENLYCYRMHYCNCPACDADKECANCNAVDSDKNPFDPVRDPLGALINPFPYRDAYICSGCDKTLVSDDISLYLKAKLKELNIIKHA